MIVSPSCAPSVEVIPSAYDFGTAAAGYGPAEPVRFTIRNAGSRPIHDLRVSIGDGVGEEFWLCLAHIADGLESVGADDSETCFYAYPMDGLGRGTHTAAIHITAQEMAPLEVALRFTVGQDT